MLSLRHASCTRISNSVVVGVIISLFCKSIKDAGATCTYVQGGLKSEAPAVSRLLIVKAFLGQTAQDSHALSTNLRTPQITASNMRAFLPLPQPGLHAALARACCMSDSAVCAQEIRSRAACCFLNCVHSKNSAPVSPSTCFPRAAFPPSAGLNSLYNADGSLCPASCLEGPSVSQDMYSGAPNAVFRVKSGDTKQRLW
eukprot:791699-Pelagomonas_calceolata.AAC.3